MQSRQTVVCLGSTYFKWICPPCLITKHDIRVECQGRAAQLQVEFMSIWLNNATYLLVYSRVHVVRVLRAVESLVSRKVLRLWNSRGVPRVGLDRNVGARPELLHVRVDEGTLEGVGRGNQLLLPLVTAREGVVSRVADGTQRLKVGVAIQT